MNCLFILMAMSQTTVTIDPAYKVTVSIQAPADVRVLANGVQITSNGVTIMVSKSGIIPAPLIPGLNPRATAFLSEYTKALPDAKKRLDGAKIAIAVLEGSLGQAGGLNWNQEQLLENVATGLTESGFGTVAKGFKFGDWLSAQKPTAVEELSSILKDVVSALKEVK